MGKWIKPSATVLLSFALVLHAVLNITIKKYLHFMANTMRIMMGYLPSKISSSSTKTQLKKEHRLFGQILDASEWKVI